MPFIIRKVRVCGNFLSQIVLQHRPHRLDRRYGIGNGKLIVHDGQIQIRPQACVPHLGQDVVYGRQPSGMLHAGITLVNLFPDLCIICRNAVHKFHCLVRQRLAVLPGILGNAFVLIFQNVYFFAEDISWEYCTNGNEAAVALLWKIC